MGHVHQRVKLAAEKAVTVRNSARDVAPDDVATARPSLPPLVDHSLLLGRDEIEQRIAAHVHKAMRFQQRFDVLPRPAAEEWELIADRGLLGSRAPPSRRLRMTRRGCRSLVRSAPASTPSVLTVGSRANSGQQRFANHDRNSLKRINLSAE